LSGAKYKDVRYSRDEWLAVKKTNVAPFNQLPILIVDSKRKIAQSHAIVRFLARATGLAGKNDTEVTDADQLAGFAEDMRKQYSTLVYNSSASTLLPTFLKETIPNFFGLLEQRLVANGGFYGTYIFLLTSPFCLIRHFSFSCPLTSPFLTDWRRWPIFRW
jgi:glutathione S-transferase